MSSDLDSDDARPTLSEGFTTAFHRRDMVAEEGSEPRCALSTPTRRPKLNSPKSRLKRLLKPARSTLALNPDDGTMPTTITDHPANERVHPQPSGFYEPRLPPTPLPTFDGDRVTTWLEDVEQIVFRIWRLSEDSWLDRIDVHLGPEPKEYYRTHLKSASWSAVKKALHDRYNSPLQQAKLVHELESICQFPEEPIGLYFGRARSLAYRIDQGMQDRELRSHIKKGIRDAEYRKEFAKGAVKPLMQLCEELTLLEAAEFESNAVSCPGRVTSGKPILSIEPAPGYHSNSSDAASHEGPPIATRSSWQEPASASWPLIQWAPVMSVSQPSAQAIHSATFCSYCKIPGHQYQDCRRKLVCTTCNRRYHTADTCVQKNVPMAGPAASPHARLPMLSQ